MQRKVDIFAATHATTFVLADDSSFEERDVGIQMMHRFEEAEAKQNLEDSQQAWQRSVNKALVGDAGKAHKWANRPNQKIAEFSLADNFSLSDSSSLWNIRKLVKVKIIQKLKK